MAKASIHVSACKVNSSELHNSRAKELDYIRVDLTPLNESFYFDRTPLPKLEKQIAKEVKQKTGRKLQKNAVPIQEAVAVIKEGTSMDDLVKFCRKMQDRWGITPLQIHIHRDEGHMRSAAVRNWRQDPENNPWKPNLHAHIVWRSVLDNGKSARLTPADYEEMQTMYAEVMGMERGKRTGRKGLSALEFKLQAKENELAELISLNETQGKTISDQQAEIAAKMQEIEKLRSDMERIRAAQAAAQEKARKAEEARQLAAAQLAEYEKGIVDAKEALDKLDEKKAIKENIVKIINTIGSTTSNAIEAISPKQRKSRQELEEQIRKLTPIAEIAPIEARKRIEAEKRVKILSDELNAVKNEKNALISNQRDVKCIYNNIDQALTISREFELTSEQMLDLAAAKEVKITSIPHNGQRIHPINCAPIRLQLWRGQLQAAFQFLQGALVCHVFKPIVEWITEALKSDRYEVYPQRNQQEQTQKRGRGR